MLQSARARADIAMVFSRIFKPRSTPKGKPASEPEPARAPDSPERRDEERFQTSVVSCELGDVSELSRSGLRLTYVGPCQLQIDQTIGLTLSSPTSDLPVSGRVTRVDRLGALRFAIGISFTDLSGDVQDQIECMGRYGTTRRPAPESDAAERLRRLSAAMNLPDHYATLGVQPTASAHEIQQAFRALARTYHPDANSDPEASAKFCEINGAHQVLGDPEKRREYDLLSGYHRAA